MPSLFKSILPILLAGCGVAGCDTPQDRGGRDRTAPNGDVIQRADRELASSPFDQQARRGVERQRTLYDHHFEPASARLSSLGRRDLTVLARMLRSDGGRISVRRGTAPEELYSARVVTVGETLVAEGVRLDRIVIDDGPPGGRGASSRDAVMIHSELSREQLTIPTGSILSSMGGATEVSR